MPHMVPKLTAPAQVPLVRQLLAHAKTAGYLHATYQINDGPVEHNWRTIGRGHEIALFEGTITYYRDGVPLLLHVPVDSAQQVADLLAVFGVVPIGLSSAYTAGQLAAAADIDAMMPAARVAVGDTYREAYRMAADRVTCLSVLLGRIGEHVRLAAQPDSGRTPEQRLAAIRALIAEHNAKRQDGAR